jgi:hypothetical protein
MLDTLLLVPSQHCNTLLHLTTLHQTKLHYTYRHFTSSHFHFTTLPFGLTHLHFLSFYFTTITKLDTVRFSQPQTYFQSNEPLHCPKELLSISLHFTLYFFLYLFFFTYPINPSLHFTLLFTSRTHIPSLPLPSLFNFYRLHFPHCFALS